MPYLTVMKKPGEYSLAAQIWALRHHGEVGPRTFRALMARLERPESVFHLEIEELMDIEGLGEKRSRKIFKADEYLAESEAFINSLANINVNYCTSFDECYPHLFAELNDPPAIIFSRGDLPRKDEKTVAIVGSHKATNEGIVYAVELATRLVEKNISIVSGLASGIDSAAHIGALKANGRTHAAIGSGLDQIYPDENRSLAAEIIRHGSVISEYPPDTKTNPGRLMARNRLVVGLSQSVVIGEVLPDSAGTLDTATFCHQLGKLMFIMIDGCDQPGRDNSAVEKIIAMGAIPFSLKDGIDLVVKSLV